MVAQKLQGRRKVLRRIFHERQRRKQSRSLSQLGYGGCPHQHELQHARDARTDREAPHRLHPCFHDPVTRDRKSTRLNSSHTVISYAVFCLKKKKKNNEPLRTTINSEQKHK